ncbi:hypothetical protein Awo_c07280 [Acetobacterium woodii DSM 1030]|uniref:Gram-positive cocci surface proteins LPxTG domain-containing protein n=2 Tax=Acetobacterium woodii TaxID=33952 RepID=H6LKD2_ACEWD|nr:hypothetical protein Awo_c07280 [Acetobacterium woodii DSM 1030]
MSKLMALLLVMLMVLMLIPASAFAAEAVQEEPTLVVLAVDGGAADEILTTAVETPAVETPAVETSTVETPAVETPAVETPAVETPAVETPAVEAPVVEGLAATESAVPVVAAPVVETQATEQEGIEVKAVPALGLWRDSTTFIDVLLNAIGADYSYDAVTNALTLNDFVGREIDATDMGSNFAMILKGTNIVATDIDSAIDVIGNLTISGDGELTAIGQHVGIHVLNGDMVINDGGIQAIAMADVDDAYGILVENGNLTINDGYIDATAINTGIGQAFGIWADNDLVVNGGNIDVVTDTVSGPTIGIGAGDDAIFNGGYTTVRSSTETGVATALLADSWVIIRGGILDLQALGGDDPLAIYGAQGVYISPEYGDVDLTASHLYLEPHYSQASTNPKTGRPDMSQSALMAVMGLLALLGTAYLIKRKNVNA